MMYWQFKDHLYNVFAIDGDKYKKNMRVKTEKQDLILA